MADVAARWCSAYVHIPFCRRRCPYCDFAVVAPEDPRVVDVDELTARYLSALGAEIEMEPEWKPLDAVNFGGGTPSAVGPEAIAMLVDALDDRFGLAPGAEVSIEANPEDITPDLLAGLVSAGVNRLSLGIQSLDDGVLQSLGRAHSAHQAIAALESALATFAVSVDLIFGTPGETIDSWAATVDQALSLYPHHLSAYALTVEPGTTLWKQVRGGAAHPDPDDQAEKYEYMQHKAREAGLIRYEVSNYARPGHTCRYNLATWGQGEYVAFGLGAHSHRRGERSRNVRSIDAYVAAIEDGHRPLAGTEVSEDREMERLILGLRRACGVDLGAWEREASESPSIIRLVDAGVVELTRGRLVVLRPLLTDEVAASVLSLSP